MFSTTAEITSDLIPMYVTCFMFTEGTGRREKRRKQLPDDQKTIRYWHLKEEALDRILWRTFGRRVGPLIRLRDDDNFQIPFGVPFVYLKPKLSYIFLRKFIILDIKGGLKRLLLGIPAISVGGILLPGWFLVPKALCELFSPATPFHSLKFLIMLS
jgi:hypothetical protein